MRDAARYALSVANVERLRRIQWMPALMRWTIAGQNRRLGVRIFIQPRDTFLKQRERLVPVPRPPKFHRQFLPPQLLSTCLLHVGLPSGLLENCHSALLSSHHPRLEA